LVAPSLPPGAADWCCFSYMPLSCLNPNG
jgi:hypothetical protein